MPAAGRTNPNPFLLGSGGGGGGGGLRNNSDDFDSWGEDDIDLDVHDHDDEAEFNPSAAHSARHRQQQHPHSNNGSHGGNNNPQAMRAGGASKTYRFEVEEGYQDQRRRGRATADHHDGGGSSKLVVGAAAFLALCFVLIVATSSTKGNGGVVNLDLPNNASAAAAVVEMEGSPGPGATGGGGEVHDEDTHDENPPVVGPSEDDTVNDSGDVDGGDAGGDGGGSSGGKDVGEMIEGWAEAEAEAEAEVKAEKNDGCDAPKALKDHLPSYDPFDDVGRWYASLFGPPPFPTSADGGEVVDGDGGGVDGGDFGATSAASSAARLGFLHSPNVRNGTLVFVTEGDLYLTYLSPEFVGRVASSRKDPDDDDGRRRRGRRLADKKTTKKKKTTGTGTTTKKKAGATSTSMTKKKGTAGTTETPTKEKKDAAIEMDTSNLSVDAEEGVKDVEEDGGDEDEEEDDASDGEDEDEEGDASELEDDGGVSTDDGGDEGGDTDEDEEEDETADGADEDEDGSDSDRGKDDEETEKEGDESQEIADDLDVDEDEDDDDDDDEDEDVAAIDAPPSYPLPDLPTVSAMRLTTTVGNVQDPRLSPSGRLVAYTATYTGNREVYVMDLDPSRRSPAVRVTYLDSKYGVEGIVGWTDDGSAVIVCATSMEISLPDPRLYKIYIKRGSGAKDRSLEGDGDDDDSNGDIEEESASTAAAQPSIGQIVPIPLAQAIDAAIDDSTGCIFFVRYKQSSQTARYVGGTAENLWAYCPDEKLSVPLTEEYRGTSKSPQIWNFVDLYDVDSAYLLFLSDRSSPDGGEGDVKASTMNLFAMPLPSQEELYGQADLPQTGEVVQLTSISCQHDGMPLSEYAIDDVRGDIILRVGADFSTLTAPEIVNLVNREKTVSIPTHAFTVAVYSDFAHRQERLFPAIIPSDLNSVDVTVTSYGQTQALLALRGQAWVTPVIDVDPEAKPYSGSGENIPARRYRVAPGGTVGGMVRILAAKYLPGNATTSSSFALVLATDPLSPTAEHAFYMVDCTASAMPSFVTSEQLPDPILGGHLNNGGSVRDGGLGSVYPDTLEVSPCGRRAAWVDTDGRIVAMTVPANYTTTSSSPSSMTKKSAKTKIHVLSNVNNLGSPIVGESSLTWSPGGRYLAITHNARNQFEIISIADLGDPTNGKIVEKDIVQATPDRFNSNSPLWGRASVDYKLGVPSDGAATVLYFLTDRDVLMKDVTSPWGTRAPSPYFPKRYVMYALPLQAPTSGEEEGDEQSSNLVGHFIGGGAAELLADAILKKAGENDTSSDSEEIEDPANNSTTDVNSTDPSSESVAAPSEPQSTLTNDTEINFGARGRTLEEFARRAYRVNAIPPARYISLLCQLRDDASFVLVEKIDEKKNVIKIFSGDDWPSDKMEMVEVTTPASAGELQAIGTSTSMKHAYFGFSGQKLKVVPNTLKGFAAMLADLTEMKKNLGDVTDLALSVQPSLEYEQMYSDAWRMLRDYFYDPGMHQVDWPSVFHRYRPLVSRCTKREELDDVLKLMASELSALHVFVYGGEYADPLHGSPTLKRIHKVASLGASLRRSTQDNGYVVTSIYERDPDFGLVDDEPIYSPLSEKTLSISGQKGLKQGDVILGINGESVLSVPDIGYLLRGLAGRSIRLDVIRKSDSGGSDKKDALIVVPITREDASDLRYTAWEWKTRQKARELAADAGFTIGYVHLRSMSGKSAEDAFVRGFFPDYNKDALIVDVRNNKGGNIDSWLLDVLQRRAWTYWEGRATNITTGGEGWDSMFAFRGHLVVLVNEHTSSDGEGFSRGVSELGLGRLIGTRTWGGGIWLSSDNKLVDGGIATAPEIGTYNDNFGWGMGIEQMGVDPDVEVDNDPRRTFDGHDDQLERAIDELKKWMKEEPIVLPKRPGPHPDMSLNEENCPST